MRAVTQLLVMDRQHAARLRAAPVITFRRVTPAETEAKAALEQSARTHIGRLALPVR